MEKLTSEEMTIISSCLRAVAEGPFIRDSAIHSRLGVYRETLYNIVEQLPEIDDSILDLDMYLAINNSMNEVCNGIRFSHADWEAWFHVDRDVVRKVFKKWKRLQDFKTDNSP